MERTLSGHKWTDQQLPDTIVVSTLPDSATSEWRETVTLRHAGQLPRASLFWDIGGIEAKRFGVKTSGMVMLFRHDGQLLLAGGVTVSRGHEGKSIGTDRLDELISQNSTEPLQSTPVFGCRLCVDNNVLPFSNSCQICQESGSSAKVEQ
ncbi:hypothetical protein GC163_08180 [bacterium]|nr:hypothetical protein [bacterium]